MGTSHSEQLNAMNNEIWDWCVARNLWISVGHIAGKSNVEADRTSRQNQTATEWMSRKHYCHVHSNNCNSHWKLTFLPLALTANFLNMWPTDLTLGQWPSMPSPYPGPG